VREFLSKWQYRICFIVMVCVASTLLHSEHLETFWSVVMYIFNALMLFSCTFRPAGMGTSPLVGGYQLRLCLSLDPVMWTTLWLHSLQTLVHLEELELACMRCTQLVPAQPCWVRSVASFVSRRTQGLLEHGC